jgi:uncharacterized membrane protein
MSAEDLESRLAALEARVAALEGETTAGPRGAQQVPPPAPHPPSVAVDVPQAAPPPAVPYWQTVLPAGRVVPAPPAAPSRPARDRSAAFADLEERLAGRALGIVGGIALILGAIFFLSLAFSRGWIGPELRVLIGLVAGAATVAGGAAFLERRNGLLGNVLTPVGLAIISISLVGATRLYHLVPVEVALLGALLSAAAVAVVAVRNDSQLVAAFGLVSVLVAPPLLGASADSTTLAFIGIVLVGTTSIALWRSWPWLPPVAFLLTVPQAASWVTSDPPVAMALIGVGAYWALNLVAAGGEEFRRHRDDLSPSASTLLLGDAAFLVWAGFTVLAGDLVGYRGLFLVAVATAHLAVGGRFVARHGDRDLFGLLTLGTGIAALTMAMPIQLGAPAVPVAWTAEAVALAWVAVRRGHPYSMAASGILYALAALAVITLYPFGGSAPTDVPFLDARGGALAFFLGGIALGVWIVRDRSIRSALASLGVSIALYASMAVLHGLAFITFVSVLMAVAAMAYRVLPRLPSHPIDWHLDGLIPPRMRDDAWRSLVDPLLPAMVAALGTIAAVHLATVELPISTINDAALPVIPFTDEGSIAAGILIAGVLASGWILGGALERGVSMLAAGAIVAYVAPFQVAPWAVAVLWAALGVGALLAVARNRVVAQAFEIAAAVAVGMAGVVAIVDVAPPSRLVVGPAATPPLMIIESVASIAAVALGTLALARSRPDPMRRWLGYTASALGVYLLSVVAIDIVGLRIGGSTPLEELETQGQVVLSVLWAILGLGGLVYGIRSSSRDARLGGLALLGVATVKVFLFDLAALDVAYRVISFIALGILLLVSAWLWQRAQPKPETPADMPLEDSGSA